ncbi:MAG TPA: 50S ribosomal protein L11 methyltransferase [Candidatus Eremiobacteraeota bacterium]|nr:MAG: Ribosomal protein L11 methyltransferase [bacterium ADurb.Bin363]HPZ07070.1 50S ribosomal protein L11 methyltransferase [Candidatus Eremiobacteraeota bacterium]
MKWIETSFLFDVSEVLSYILQDITEGNGFLEEPLGDKVLYKFYLPEDENFEKKFDKLKLSLLEIDKEVPEITCKDICHQDWSEEWKKSFEPLKITKNIVIRPPWKEYISDHKELVIIINPSMAFGTGHHETTRMAAFLIEKYACAVDSLLDLGCGTGILSIIACLLVVKRVYAIDNDILAISALKENLALNNLEDRVEAFHMEGLKDFPYMVNLLVANIQASVFKEIRKEFSPVLSSDGILILTGILEEQKDEIFRLFYEEGFKFVEEIKDGEWVSLVMRKSF